MLKDALKAHLSEEEITSLSSSFDIIGDIAIIKIPQELQSKERIIGEEILRKTKNVKTVLRQDSDVRGDYRTREVSLIAGEERYETLYKESGLRFRVNVKSAYFSPRLSTERLRIRALVKEGERILNMFAGVGTFSFVVAKIVRCEVDSIDINPEAIRLANESLRLNKKLKGIVNPILADARAFANSRLGIYDRILMPLPERAHDFFQSAVDSAKQGAMIHYYVHVPEENYYDENWIQGHLEEMKIHRGYKVENWKKVREVGPRYIQAVADIRII